MPTSTAAGSKPRQKTAERILVATLALFNRFGEPNVSTTLISAELKISPGNLYYHFPAKEALINALFDRYEEQLRRLLAAAGEVRNVEDAWLFFHILYELIWQQRFLYRDLNDLLSRNRRLETRFQALLDAKGHAMRDLLSGLQHGGALRMTLREAAPIGRTMVVLLNYWLSDEYVRDPRHALEPERAGLALMRGAFHVLSLLLPYLEPASREHLFALASRYQRESVEAGS